MLNPTTIYKSSTSNARYPKHLTQDGTVVTWGGTDHGGNSCPMQDRPLPVESAYINPKPQALNRVLENVVV